MMASKQGETNIVQLLLNQENIDVDAESKVHMFLTYFAIVIKMHLFIGSRNCIAHGMHAEKRKQRSG